MGRKNYEYANKSGNCADVTHSTKAKVVGLPINYILYIHVLVGFKSCVFLDVDRKDRFSSQHRYETDLNGSLHLWSGMGEVCIYMCACHFRWYSSKFKNLSMYFQSYLRLDFTMSLSSLSLIINGSLCTSAYFKVD